MLLKVVGLERRVGEFIDKETGEKVGYDNILLHCVNVDPSPFQKIGLLSGNRVCEVKLKNKFSELVYVGEFPVKSWNDIQDCTVDLGVDADGKILGIVVTAIE